MAETNQGKLALLQRRQADKSRFLSGIPFAVLSPLCSGLFLLFQFRRLSDGFWLCLGLNCIFPVMVVYVAAGVLSGSSR